MPIRAPSVCTCGKTVPSGTRCACKAQADRERKARHDQNRPSAQDRGYGGKWQKARAAFLKAHAHCFLCGQPATVVHHRTPHRGDQKLFWRQSNWAPACKPCHDGPLQSQEKRA